MDNNFDFGLKDYPIFDEDYRKTLNENILMYYYENEIGFETAGLFKKYLNSKMKLIMPFYNEVYKLQTETLKSKINANVDLEETFTRDTSNKNETNSNSTSSSQNNANNKSIFQDTPQGKIYQNDINNMQYATNVTIDNSNTNNNTNINDNATNNGTGTENYIKKIIGNNGNKYNYEVLLQVKNSIFNIDLQIINELSDLFMQIY